MQRLGIHPFLIRGYKNLFRHFGSRTVEHTVDGHTISFPLQKRWQHERFFYLEERELLEDFLSEIREDDIVYDIGAYVGSQTLVAASAVPAGEVIAFEPHPESYSRLDELVSWSEYEIDTYQIALAAEDKTISMREVGVPRASIYDDAVDSIEADAVRGDVFVRKNNLPTPTVLKIDVEGAEVEVLHGLEEQLSHPDCRLVYCELHRQLAPGDQELSDTIVDTLEQFGFECTLTEYGKKEFLKAKKRPSES